MQPIHYLSDALSPSGTGPDAVLRVRMVHSRSAWCPSVWTELMRRSGGSQEGRRGDAQDTRCGVNLSLSGARSLPYHYGRRPTPRLLVVGAPIFNQKQGPMGNSC